MNTYLKTLMSICFVFAFLLFPFSRHANAQAYESPLVREIDSINSNFPFEKAYLHLDRGSYWANDDVWFKAYLKNSPVAETNLYVELLSPSGKVIQRKTYLAIGGLAYGDIHLPDTTSTGVYQIRAYTNWMRNFDQGCLFRRDIVVWNLSDKDFRISAAAPKKTGIDVQFFPEGGTFVAGAVRRVGFKAVDKNGRGIDVEGHVENTAGDTVATFKSAYKGMGSFIMSPSEGQRYRAKVAANGIGQWYVNLPQPSAGGISLAAGQTPDGRMFVGVEGRPGDEITLVGQSNGSLVFAKRAQLDGGRFAANLQKGQLPSGVLQLTVFDGNNVPRCERLVFVNNGDRATVSLKTDKPAYATREKVTLELRSLLPDGSTFPSNLSVSVFDANAQLLVEKHPGNILTHFLLSSELKGAVEEPGYYFNDGSASTLAALDNLMLTQGWRQFVQGRAIAGMDFGRGHLPETMGLSIEGRARKIWADKPVAGAKVSLLFLKKQKGFYTTVADNDGRFRFDNLYFYDSVYFSVQAKDQKGGKNTWIDIDGRESEPPPALYLPTGYFYRETDNAAVATTYYLSEAESEKIKRKWNLSDTILLARVEVVAKRPIKDDGHIRQYFEADKVLVVDEEDAIECNILKMAANKFHVVYYDCGISAIRVRNNQNPPLLLLDGMPIGISVLESMSISEFDKVELLFFAPMYGSRGADGAINFLRKWKFEPPKQIDSKGMRSGSMVGYSTIRRFYEPQYGPDMPANEKLDLRATLYWNPFVQTDPEGKSELSFYNSDQTGEFEIVVEGLGENGKICRGTLKYKVQ